MLASKKLHTKPDECIVFEDAVLGVEAAKNAGMSCVGIDRYGERDRLKKADIIVSDAGETTVKKLERIVNQ